MDPWGSLTMLLKKQEVAKNRKAALKYELQKRREVLLKGGARKEMEFPEISKTDITILKEGIRRKHKADQTKNIIIYILFFILVLFLIYYVVVNTKWEAINGI
ncbi:hypothetical protein [Polaribacter sp. Hel_I_88]|uniref:hypothetical protein n=1 Tax=Polaribacter sp. Hel_I_88 TaxID=1250006 RepID=UPI00047C7D40|nr:hypothetical protein [Polaribacter sp. Hel_I_88]